MNQAPTKGRMLDHIGFEVKNLEAFCRRLEGLGGSMPLYGSSGVATAFLTRSLGNLHRIDGGLNRSVDPSR